MLVGALLVAYVAFVSSAPRWPPSHRRPRSRQEQPPTPGTSRNNRTLFLAGRNIFRYDTFGDEAFWGDTLQLHQAIAGAKNGGVGPGVSPKAGAGRRPQGRRRRRSRRRRRPAIKAGKVDLNDPAMTLALLKLNAVVGVTGFFDRGGQLTSIGIKCALCHSTVDDSFAPGIGRRLDGWPNRDLNVGAIVALAPNSTPLTDLLGVDEATVRHGARQLGARASSTPSSSSTARRSAPTARRRRR